MMTRQLTKEEKAKFNRELALMRDIPEEALVWLEARFGVGLPCFQLREKDGTPISGDASTHALRAAMRDGNHEVLHLIRKMRSMNPLT